MMMNAALTRGSANVRALTQTRGAVARSTPRRPLAVRAQQPQVGVWVVGPQPLVRLTASQPLGVGCLFLFFLVASHHLKPEAALLPILWPITAAMPLCLISSSFLPSFTAGSPAAPADLCSARGTAYLQ